MGASRTGEDRRGGAEPRDPRLLVIALGSRALASPRDLPAPDDWVVSLEGRLGPLADLVAAGFRLVLTHGNRVELAEALQRTELARRTVAVSSLDRCVAGTQGSLGYALQQALGNLCRARGLDTGVVTVVTRVLVDAADPALARPRAPVGPPYPLGKARALARAHGWTVVEEAGLGRRAVPAPEPRWIVETPVVRRLVEAGVVPVACGGGGVPVIETAAGYRAIAAVVEPDLATETLATALHADRLVFLTGVSEVRVGFGTPRAIGIERLSGAEARALQAAGEFPADSMGPKVEAGLRFVAAGGREAIVTDLEHVRAAIDGKAGTRIVR